MKVSIHGLFNFIAVLLISAGLHRLIPTYFYISVLSAPIAAVIAYLQFRYFFRNVQLGTKQLRNLILVLFMIMSSLFSFSFHSTVPLNVDRSFSVWMINKIATDPEMRNFSTLEENASKFFSPEKGEIKRRLNEQISLGNLEVVDNRVELTSSGHRVWKSNRFLASLFGLNKNYAG
jgi:hypothetical protein